MLFIHLLQRDMQELPDNTAHGIQALLHHCHIRKRKHPAKHRKTQQNTKWECAVYIWNEMDRRLTKGRAIFLISGAIRT
jgi:hypothetical protein